MSAPLNWDREGRIWPHRGASSFVSAAGLDWHVQRKGPGDAKAPKLLLLHGTGASVHSWHRVLPILAKHFDVLVPDLPGHAFTRGKPPGGLTLDAIVRAIDGLLQQEEFVPDMIVGHSAGAAIAIGWTLRQSSSVPIAGLNPAIMPFRGPAAQVFPAMAKLLLVNPFAPRIFARMAKIRGEAGRFLSRSTGSRTDETSEACYAALFGNHRHARGALEMMANWDLDGLKRQLPKVGSPALLIHADADRAIPLSSVQTAAKLLPECRLEMIAGAGHLAHEEKPEAVAQLVADFAREHAILPQIESEEA